MIKFILTTTFLFFSQNLFAQTYFQVLENNFESAQDNIVLTDVERPGTARARVCLEVSAKVPYKENYVRIDRFTQNKEGQGPLLPPTTITKVIYRTWINNVFAEGTFDSTTTFLNESPLQIESRLMDHEGNTTWTLLVRKSGNFLVFSRAERVPGNKEEEIPDSTLQHYGYCYHMPAVK